MPLMVHIDILDCQKSGRTQKRGPDMHHSENKGA